MYYILYNPYFVNFDAIDGFLVFLLFLNLIFIILNVVLHGNVLYVIH